MADRASQAPPERPNYRRMGATGQVVRPKNMKGTLRRLWDVTRGGRRGLGAALALSAAVSLFAMTTPLIIGRAVDRIDAGDPARSLLCLLAAVYLGEWAVRTSQVVLMAGVSQRVICQLRKSLFAVMKRLPLRFFDRQQHGDLMSRLTNDVDNISTTIADSLTQLMTLGFSLVGILGVMLWLSPVLTLAALGTAPLVFLLTKAVTKRTRPLYRKQQEVLGALGGHIEESISGLALVKAFGQEERMVRRFEERSEELCRVGTRALIWSGFLMPLMNVIQNLSFICVSIVSGLMAARGLITVGVISTFLLYSRQFSRPLNEVASLYNVFQTAVAGAERIFQVFDEEPEPRDLPGALPISHTGGEVEFQNVSFGYDPGAPILRDVSFHVPAGSRIAIVGPTGAGKTTIISLLTRFYDVGEGSILLDGRDLREYRLRDLRSMFGVVLQDTALFDVTIRENIRYGREEATDREVEEAARAAGAHGFITRLPRGYDTLVGEGGGSFSQGERQLITIARAILADAPILILDEATSSVDTRTEERIRRAVDALTQNRTSFMIAHRLSTIRGCDRILVLQDGKIAEEGTHRELMEQGGIYASMYRTQLGGKTDGE